MSCLTIKWFFFGLALAIASTAVLVSARIDSRYVHEVSIGSGRAYAILGDLPVMHRGRMKPFDSMATEKVNLIHGRSTIKLLDPERKTISRWEPVAALLDWSARPDFWDEQDFILVEYPPLNRLLLQASLRARVRSLADKETPAVGRSLQTLGAQPVLTEADLRTAARQVSEASTTANSLHALAAKVGQDHKWLSPRVLENTQLQLEGHTLTFPQWVGEILDKKERARTAGMGVALKLTLIEEKATEVGERFFHYKAIREHDSPASNPLALLVTPRPSNEMYLKYSTEIFEKGMKSDQSLSPLGNNVANTLVEYLEGIQSKDWALPGEDEIFDGNFLRWLDGSPWIPLGVILESDESELSDAGLPFTQVLALRESYRNLEAAARAEPGNVPEPIAVALISAARDLGGWSSRYYPEPSTMARETRLNRFAPFSMAPIAHGVALVLILLSLGITASLRTAAGKLGAALYCLGIAGLLAGIALELYGFLVRYRITRWGPVTTIYETVFWVALATSALGLVFELFWRKKYSALAASGIALLATFLAENVSILDPNIRAVEPVLQTKLWLPAHVLTIVSSYAAFALALGLGLLAVGHYLTATYRRSPTYLELAWPLLPGIPLYVLGSIGMDTQYRLLPLSVVHPELFYYLSSGLASIGGVLTIVGGFSLAGEFANRSPWRACVLGVILAAVGSMGIIAGTTGAVQGPWAIAHSSYNGCFVGLVGGALTVMSLLAVQAKENFARIETLANFIYRAMQVGVLLLAAGTIVGSAWAHKAWGGYWHWDPKEILALITLLVYLVPLHGRFAGWISTFGLATASVACFMTVLMSWYGVNFVLRLGRHNYGFTEGGDSGTMLASALALLAVAGAAVWRRSRSLYYCHVSLPALTTISTVSTSENPHD